MSNYFLLPVDISCTEEGGKIESCKRALQFSKWNARHLVIKNSALELGKKTRKAFSLKKKKCLNGKVFFVKKKTGYECTGGKGGGDSCNDVYITIVLWVGIVPRVFVDILIDLHLF